MDVKRYFRGPFVAVLVVLLLFFFLYRYASSGTSYKSVDTSQVINLIESGQVKSALLVDTDQTIQITTKSGQTLQASWVGSQGQQLAVTLQQEYAKGNLPQGYNVEVPKGSSILGLIGTWLPLLLTVHTASFVLWFGAMTIHVLGHLGEVFRLAPRDWLRRTRREVTGAGRVPTPMASSCSRSPGPR